MDIVKVKENNVLPTSRTSSVGCRHLLTISDKSTTLAGPRDCGVASAGTGMASASGLSLGQNYMEYWLSRDATHVLPERSIQSEEMGTIDVVCWRCYCL